MRPVIAITMGDAAGVGPEVVRKALEDPGLRALAEWVVVGDAAVLGPLPEGVRTVDLNLLRPADFKVGELSAACGRAALEYVRVATEMCLRGEARAMVTAPLNKEAVALSGRRFSGHTEYIAELCGGADSRMLLVSERLRVAHVTTHRALREACNLDRERILRTIELGDEALERMGIEQRRIAVCGLNPHAGENGLFGSEDAEFIAPAVEAARARGIRCGGPFAADTIFMKALRGDYDLVVAMYHDQGHIPMKLLDFENAVNVSLGLPITRTSVDHGTAFDIAGKGLANPASLKAAMRLAALMSPKPGDSPT
jgi:4-hydroxythreonine-4-phosphate dehydrogenase